MRFSLFERIDTESGLYAVICDTTLNWQNTFTFQAHKWHYSGVIKVSRLVFATFTLSDNRSRHCKGLCLQIEVLLHVTTQEWPNGSLCGVI